MSLCGWESDVDGRMECVGDAGYYRWNKSNVLPVIIGFGQYRPHRCTRWTISDFLGFIKNDAAEDHSMSAVVFDVS